MLFSPHDELPLPDNYAHYWRYRFAVDANSGVRLKASGQFPYARYMSFNVYDQATGNPADALPDLAIQPDAGATNPFVDGADRAAEQRSFTVWLTPAGQAPAVNGLSMPPAKDGAQRLAVELWYRVYSADVGRSTLGGEPLPTVTAFAADGTTPAACPAREADKIPVATVLRNIPPRTEDGVLHFYHAASDAAYANIDNKYLATQLDFAAGDVAVVRAKVPTAPLTAAGGGRFDAATEVRYWSFCVTGLATETKGCIADEQARVGADGVATFVVGPAEVAEAARSHGFNYLPRSPLLMPLVVYRQMLAQPDFAGAIAKVPAWPAPRGTVVLDPTYLAAESYLGAYAPTGKHCSTAAFLANACGFPDTTGGRDTASTFAGPGQRGPRPAGKAIQVGLSWSQFFAPLIAGNLSLTPPDPVATNALLNQAQGALKSFLEARTGQTVNVESVTLDGLIEGLDRGDYDLGLVSGLDYATVTAAYPNLQPVVFGNLGRRIGPGVTSHIVVRDDSGLRSVADLAGKKLAMSRFTRYSDLDFLRRTVVGSGAAWIGFFTPPRRVADATKAAIEDVVNGDADVIAVSGDDLRAYQRHHPRKARRLLALADSDALPAPALLYNQRTPPAFDIAALQRDLVLGAASGLKTEIMVRKIFGIQEFGFLDQPYLDLLQTAPDEFQDYAPPTLFFGW